MMVVAVWKKNTAWSLRWEAKCCCSSSWVFNFSTPHTLHPWYHQVLCCFRTTTNNQNHHIINHWTCPYWRSLKKTSISMPTLNCKQLIMWQSMEHSHVMFIIVYLNYTKMLEWVKIVVQYIRFRKGVHGIKRKYKRI